MDVGCHLLLERIGPRLRAPHLRPAEEYPLIAGEAAKHGAG